jgi:DNA-binding LytR/AlgR family response regulator
MINSNQIKNLKKAEVVLVEMNCGCKVPVSQSKIKEFSELLDKDN